MTILAAFLFLAMAATLATLGYGLFTMSRGGGVSAAKSNRLMWRRVFFQGIALALFAILLMLKQGS